MLKDNGDGTWTVGLSDAAISSGKVATNGSTVDTLDNVLAASTSGQVVNVYGDADLSQYIPAGITLKLNGNTVTATDGYFAGFGKVEDDGSGKLIADKGHIYIADNGGYLPVYDTDGYRFVPLETKKSEQDSSYEGAGSKFNFRFNLHEMEDGIKTLLNGGKSSSDVGAWVRLSWPTSGGVVSMDYPFSDDDLIGTLTTKRLFIIVRGAGMIGSGNTLTVTPLLRFGLNSEVKGTPVSMTIA